MEKIMVEVSARHVHLTQDDVNTLFGENYELTVDKWLSQPGQFLAKEKVIVVGPKKTFEKVGIIGPTRKHTQFELSKTDCFAFGIKGSLRESGDLIGTEGFEIKTERASLKVDSGAIIAKRHIHMTPSDAERFNVKNGDIVSVKVDSGEGRAIVYCDTVVRVSDNYALAMHIDTDEANAGLVSVKALGEIV